MDRDVPEPGALAVVVLVDTARDRWLGGVWRLVTGRWRLSGIPGATFLKVLGSGRDGGFVPVPSLTHQGLFVSFVDEAAADAFLASDGLAAYRRDSAQFLTLKLRAFSARGSWSGRAPLRVTVDEPTAGPVASLTRASIRPTKTVSFWRHAPPSEIALHRADGCLIAAGLGEAPFFRQATFTVWRDMAAMHAFARHGAHLEALQRARAEGHFSEDLFARFVPSEITGTWKGRTFDGSSL